MPDIRKRAFAAASLYAPEPNGSIVVYGLTGSAVFGLLAMLFGWFYGVDLTPHLLLIGLCLVLAFGIGVVIRNRRKRLHQEAFAIEHGRLGPGPEITRAG